MAIKKKKVAFLYPGQGAQMPGMGLDFYEQNSASAAVVDTAQSVLDFEVKSLCFAKNDLLIRSEYTQPCLVTCCLAMTAAILETGIAPNMTAGLSLGEYAAIATAGVVPGMAEAFKKAIEAGRSAYLSGLGRTIERGASASSPLTGFLED